MKQRMLLDAKTFDSIWNEDMQARWVQVMRQPPKTSTPDAQAEL